jgi:hypothetical protein
MTSKPPTFALRGRCSGQLNYPGMIDSEPRARFELAPARYNVAALPHELSRHGLGGGPRSRTTGLEGQRAACLRHSQLVEVRAARLERALAVV